MMTDKVLQLINGMSVGKKKYENQKALKLGFKSLEDYVRQKLNEQNTLRNKTTNQGQLNKLSNLVIKRKIAEADYWKKTTTDGKPFFDSTYFLFHRKVDRTNFSKEMFEWFIKSIGNLNPFDLDIGKRSTAYKGEDFSKAGITLNYIQDGLDFLLGVYLIDMKWMNKNPSKLVQQVQTQDMKNLPFQVFAELEHHIKNDLMFWCVFEYIYVMRGKFFTDECFERYGRLKIPLKERMRSAELLSTKLKEDDDRYSVQFKDKTDSPFAEHLSVVFDAWEDDEDLAIYRSFKVEKGKAIRKGITMDSADKDIHIAGSGFSYSLSKMVAIRLSWFITSHLIRKYTGVGKEQSERMLGRNWISEGQMKNPTFFDDFYTCIGLFHIKKKDIIFMTESMAEAEIIISPKKVKLLDYRFLNIVDTIAFHTTLNINRMAVGSDGAEMSGYENKDSNLVALTQTYNIDGLYDWVWAMTKKRLQAQPEYPRQVMNSNRFSWIQPHIKYIFKEMDKILKQYPKRKSKIHDKEDSFMTGVKFNWGNRYYTEIVYNDYSFPEMNFPSVRQRYAITKKLMDTTSSYHEAKEEHMIKEETVKEEQSLFAVPPPTNTPIGNTLLAEAVKKSLKLY